MKLTLLGAGYVGLVTAACFAEMGNTVTCLDTDEEKISLLNSGKVPLYERGLDRIIAHNVRDNRLSFTVDSKVAISDAEVIFICVNTPPGEDGAVNLSSVFESARTIGRFVEGYAVIVTKSTVPVGTTVRVGHIIREEIIRRKSDARIDLVNNPEFLKEGSAVADFMGPDRVVIGTCSERAARIMRRLYAPFLRTDDRVIEMSIESSELTKYASNAMLATRISFMNEMALLAEKAGADIEEIRKGMAMDKRIGKYFLYAGSGFGGSCFPKDLSALMHMGRSMGRQMRLVTATYEVNRHQKRVIADKVRCFFNDTLQGIRIAMWGLAFKPDTDDIREAPSIVVAKDLVSTGAELSVHDPEALGNARRVLGDSSITYHTDPYEAVKGSRALIIMTEWKEYRTPDWSRIHHLMTEPVVFDGRNLFNPEDMKELGFRYFGIGHGERIEGD